LHLASILNVNGDMFANAYSDFQEKPSQASEIGRQITIAIGGDSVSVA
jgi:hypothetical protein